ncbi:hypothetical protein ACYJ1Y_12830 [Natrialbaceae archaeon A-gly3]
MYSHRPDNINDYYRSWYYEGRQRARITRARVGQRARVQVTASDVRWRMVAKYRVHWRGTVV